MEREERQRLEHEGHVASMEQEEMELIQRLQNTQLLQKAAYEDLENALQGESVAVPEPERPKTSSKRGKGGAKVGSKRS